MQIGKSFVIGWPGQFMEKSDSYMKMNISVIHILCYKSCNPPLYSNPLSENSGFTPAIILIL